MTDTELLMEARKWVGRHAEALLNKQISFNRFSSQIWRVFIRFSLAQEAQIVAAIDTGDIEAARAIITAEFDKELGERVK